MQQLRSLNLDGPRVSDSRGELKAARPNLDVRR